MDSFKSRQAMHKLIVVMSMMMLYSSLRAQADTISFSIQEADKRFLDSNLSLLASHYNVDASRALIEQAKLWPNPVLNTDQNVYSNNHFFEHGKDAKGSPTGQYFVQLQQLILTAGKRGRQVDLATTNSRISELQLQDLLRNLHYELHTDYYNVTQILKNKTLLTLQAQRLGNLETAMAAQYKAGNIAQRDYLRIQALVIQLQQDIAQSERDILSAEQDLKMLLMIPVQSFVMPSDTISDKALSLPDNLDGIIQTAKQNNAYYLLQQAQVLYSNQNLAYQKALRSPDVLLGPEFDKNSNYTPNYVGLGVSLPLPLWNRNQGNIKSAQYTVQQQRAEAGAADVRLQQDVNGAYQRLLNIYNLNNNTQREFYSSYNTLFNNMVQSYQQRQISLLEFLDFADSYQEAQARLFQQQSSLQLAKEELNYQAGSDVVK